MPYNVLIIGARGFLGRHLCAEFAAQGAAVRGVDRFDPAHPVDIGDPVQAEHVVREAAPDFVVHAAGRVGAASEAELRAAHLAPTLALLDAIARARPEARILVVGSAAELGVQPGCRAYPECEAGSPVSAYGRSKLEQAQAARERALQLGVDLIRVRLFNTLGPGQSPALVGGAMVERLYNLAPGGADKFVVFDPESRRDFLDVRDIARLMRRLLEALPKDPARVPVNVCSGVATSIAALAGELLSVAGVETRVAFDRPAGGATQIAGVGSTLAQVLRPGEPVASIDTLTSLRDMWQARLAAGTPDPRP